MRDETVDASTYLLANPPFVGAAAVFAMDGGALSMTLTDPASGEAFVFSSASYDIESDASRLAAVTNEQR